MRQHPWLCTVIAVTLIFSLFGIGYTADDSLAVATEHWESAADRGKGEGMWTFSQKSDGTVTVAGEWTYEDTVTCPFTAGSVHISGPSFSFTVEGIATYSLAPPGHLNAPFTLKVKGATSDGKGKGTYTITFSAQEWPPGFSGEWQATRIEGAGITE